MDRVTRTKVISRNAFFSLFIKGGQVITSLILVRILLNYLGEYEYGLWLTISSVLAWVSMFNLGLGHGMRNKVAEALAVGETQKAQAYISTTYGLLAGLSIILVLLFLPFYFYIDWYSFFNVKKEISTPLNAIVFMVFISIIVQFVIGLIRTVLTAIHKIAVAEALILASNICVTVGISICLYSNIKSLFVVALFYACSPVIILTTSSVILYLSREYLCPSIKKIDKSTIPDLFTLGIKFFGLQIAGLILFSTDNFIITKLFSPEEVTPYNISYKYFSIVAILFSTISAPFWSGVTDAYSSNDYSWIKKAIKNLILLLFLTIPFIIIMVYFSNDIYRIWLGRQLGIPLLLSFTFGVYIFIGAWNGIFSMVINGIGKLQLAFGIAVFSALINIPLSIFLARELEWGVMGVAWATIFCQFLSAIIIPIQLYKIMNNKAIGIWRA